MFIVSPRDPSLKSSSWTTREEAEECAATWRALNVRVDIVDLRTRLLNELHNSTYQMIAEYALRDFGTALRPVLDAAIEGGEVEVVEVRTDTSRFPGTPVRFVRAAKVEAI